MDNLDEAGTENNVRNWQSFKEISESSLCRENGVILTSFMNIFLT